MIFAFCLICFFPFHQSGAGHFLLPYSKTSKWEVFSIISSQYKISFICHFFILSWTLSMSSINPWSLTPLLLCVVKKPSAHVVVQLQMLLLLHGFFPALLLCQHHQTLPLVPFSPLERLTEPLQTQLCFFQSAWHCTVRVYYLQIAMQNIQSLPDYYTARDSAEILVSLFPVEHLQNFHSFWKGGAYWTTH